MKKQNINLLLIAGYVMFAIFIIATNLERQDYYPVVQAGVELLMLPLPTFILKTFKISINYKALSVYYIFCVLSRGNHYIQ
ncbi:MAG: hypothetical protein ACRCZH_00045 [Cetobacterium sp.]